MVQSILAYVLITVIDRPAKRLDEFLPDRWKKIRDEANAR
jgi:hypothetical protein